MRFIKSYPNDAAIQGALDNGSLAAPYIALNDETHKIEWTDYSRLYFTIEALESGVFYIRKSDFNYSINGGDWISTTGLTELSLNQGDSVRIKGTTRADYLLSGQTKSFNAYGNIESLEYGDNFIGKTQTEINDRAFYGLFSNSKKLMDVSNLILPSTKTQVGTYSYMFSGCISIEVAPVLPQASLTNTCYRGMFSGCSSLKYIKCLATNITARYCLSNWVSGVSSTGTFVKNPAMNDWPTGSSGIPTGWTVIDAQ